MSGCDCDTCNVKNECRKFDEKFSPPCSRIHKSIELPKEYEETLRKAYPNK